MTKAPIAVVAQHPAHLPGLMIVIHYQRLFYPANDALFRRGF